MNKDNCEHKFTYLRQEERNIGYDRDPLWLIQDVYFCEKCLSYKRVDVRKERPARDSFDRRIVENPLVDAAVAILSDPSELLPEMVWVEEESDVTARTALGVYLVWAGATSGWWWSFAPEFDAKACDSLEAGKAACREHLRAKVRELFGVKV